MIKKHQIIKIFDLKLFQKKFFCLNEAVVKKIKYLFFFTSKRSKSTIFQLKIKSHKKFELLNDLDTKLV